jgi:methylglutaconyl-CoA hydratase
MYYQNGEAYIKVLQQQGITTIEFFHPKSNSLPGEMMRALASVITYTGNDKNCKVIILGSGGEAAFCAGANFDELLQIETPEQGLTFFSGFAHVINAMRQCPQLIVGRIHGKATGGGIGLAASCDYALATEGADIKLSELAVGIGPYVVGPAIERKIGLSAFSQIALDAYNWRTAAWAQKAGLYAELHASRETLNEAVDRFAANLAKSNPEALVELKQIFWKGTGHWDELLAERAAISGRLVLSDFTREAIAKFKLKK